MHIYYSILVSEGKLRRGSSAEQTKAPIATVSLGTADDTHCLPIPLSIQIPLALNCHLCLSHGVTKFFISEESEPLVTRKMHCSDPPSRKDVLLSARRRAV